MSEFTVKEHPRGGLEYFRDGKSYPAEGEQLDHVAIITALARELAAVTAADRWGIEMIRALTSDEVAVLRERADKGPSLHCDCDSSPELCTCSTIIMLCDEWAAMRGNAQALPRPVMVIGPNTTSGNENFPPSSGLDYSAARLLLWFKSWNDAVVYEAAHASSVPSTDRGTP